MGSWKIVKLSEDMCVCVCGLTCCYLGGALFFYTHFMNVFTDY